MLHVGLDLSRKQVEVCLISDQGELIDRFESLLIQGTAIAVHQASEVLLKARDFMGRQALILHFEGQGLERCGHQATGS